MELRTVDLFAGCGGLSLGFQKAGFNIVAAFELWDAAVKCYQENFSHPIYQMDLSDVENAVGIISEYNPDIIIGGPPCQDFSHAGKRIEASRASLTDSYAQIISRARPKCFIMENVDRARNSNAYAQARETFKKAGYGLTEIVLDASLCGTPQKRKRFICFGMQGQEDGFATGAFQNGFASKAMTLRDYFGDTLGFEYYYRHPRNYNRRAVFSIDEPAPTMRGVNRPVPKGYHGHPNDACPVSENLHALTTMERAKIQTFPDDYQWIGNKTDIEQMIGNAVPINLGCFIAKTAKQIMEEQADD
jgi:DNA (cytosine-5)-methyltransferase 1